MERVPLRFMPHGQRSLLANIPRGLSPAMTAALQAVRFEGPSLTPGALQLFTQEQMGHLMQLASGQHIRPFALLMREIPHPSLRWLRIPAFHADAAGIQMDAWLILTDSGELLVTPKKESDYTSDSFRPG